MSYPSQFYYIKIIVYWWLIGSCTHANVTCEGVLLSSPIILSEATRRRVSLDMNAVSN